VNEALAEAQATEAARQDRIRTLTDALRDDPSDADTLSALADAYLAGATEADLVAAASALQVLIALDPGRVDAYERIMTAYLRAGDDANARAAHGSYVALDGADPAEAAFFDGLIALRGENDPDRAATAFERFLELSPDDPRAGMIRGLLEESRGDP
jgi:Flp pilus assembly protein TadD